MKTKRILMVLLAAVMVFAMTISVAFADEDDYKAPDMENVAGIEFEPAGGQILLEELVDGSYNDEEAFYCYNVSGKIFRNGSKLILVMKDGTRSTFVYDRSQYAFIGEGGYGIDYDDVDTNAWRVQYENEWGLGDHIFNVEYKGFTCSLTATVIDNGIEKAEYIPYKPYELIEKWDGFWDTDESGSKFFNYCYSINDKDTIKLTMKNGRVKTYIYEKEYKEYDDYDDYRFFSSEDDTYISSINFTRTDDQEQHHWAKGGNYFITFEYAGKKSRIPVTIVESPIDSISYEPISSIIYTENVNGWEEEDSAGNKYFEYMEPEPKKGDKLIIVKNGVRKIYTYSEKGHSFIGDDESIDKYDIEFWTNQAERHWTIGSDNECIIYYLGRECKVQVTIKTNTVTEISYEPAVPYEYEEHDKERGEWDEGYDDHSYFRYDTPRKTDGDKLNVVSGGSSKAYVYNYAKGEYISSDGETIDEDDVRLNTEQYTNHWEPDKENYMTVEYMARECKVPVIIHAENTMETSGKTIKVKFAKLKKKTQKIKLGKAFVIKDARGKVTFKLAKKDKKAKNKITVSKNGQVTVKKGLKKGKYTIKVKVTAAGNRIYHPVTKTVSVKVVVK